MKKCVLIVSHGSREISANREFKRLAQNYRKRHPLWEIRHAFLELASPSIPEALETLVRSAKSNEILVLPFFLFAARHVKKDIPEILKAFRKKNTRVKIKWGRPLGSDPKLLDILDQRLKQVSFK
jgi:sirohydrochlorin cobaltochelatase